MEDRDGVWHCRCRKESLKGFIEKEWVRDKKKTRQRLGRREEEGKKER